VRGATSIVAPSASAATLLVLVVAYAGFASPLVVLITFAGSLLASTLHVTIAPWALFIVVETHYSAAVLSPASSPNQRLTDLTDAMIHALPPSPASRRRPRWTSRPRTPAAPSP
jgi:predicted anti-sigma-YlaC factor YlaD